MVDTAIDSNSAHNVFDEEERIKLVSLQFLANELCTDLAIPVLNPAHFLAPSTQ